MYKKFKEWLSPNPTLIPKAGEDLKNSVHRCITCNSKMITSPPSTYISAVISNDRQEIPLSFICGKCGAGWAVTYTISKVE